MSITGTFTGARYTSLGLFGAMQEAYTGDLNIEGNIDATTDTSTKGRAGLLAGSALMSKVHNINTTGSVRVTSTASLSVGGVAGQCSGVFSNISSSGAEVSGTSTRTATDPSDSAIYVGGLFGYMGKNNNGDFLSDSHSTITKIHAEGSTLYDTLYGEVCAGGLVGYLSNDGISRSYYKGGTISAENKRLNATAGGIAGCSNNRPVISQVYSMGTSVTAISSNSYDTTASAAGIIGILWGSVNNSYSTIENIYAESNNTASAERSAIAGGVTGTVLRADGGVTNSYYAGVDIKADGKDAGTVAGGIAGASSIEIVDKCVALNSSITTITTNTAKDHIKRIVGGANYEKTGTNYAITPMIVNSAAYSAGDDDKGKGYTKSNSQLQSQSTYQNGLGWDFDNIWEMGDIDGRTLPVFIWQ